MERICEKMPKVELHAHLNGSIPDQICQQLLELKNKGGSNEDMIFLTSKDSKCTLEKCFEKFAQIHRLIQSTDILKWVTIEVIRNFAEDYVIYLELRTTPKSVHEISSKDAYIESVIHGILESQKKFPILVKLLISIDRKMGRLEGDENIELAIKWRCKYPDIVAGIDLSGDPTKGNLEWILPLLSKAKLNGFQITCHLPEVKNPLEAKQLLELVPNRVGHGLYLHPEHGGNRQLWQLLKGSKIPLEICITSNVVAGISKDQESHHVKYCYLESMPYVICTDDSGIFNTTLSQEYKKYLNIIGDSSQRPSPNPNELKDLCLASIDYTFGTRSEKDDLKKLMETWWEENSNWISKI